MYELEWSVDDQARQQLEDAVSACEVQLSEAEKQKAECREMGKKVAENLKHQLAELNIAYNNAIVILSEKKKEFAELLTQSAEESKKQLEQFKTNVEEKVKRVGESMETLKNFSAKLKQTPYEEIHRAVVQTRLTSKFFADSSLPELSCGYFKNSIDLNELGKVQYARLNEALKTLRKHKSLKGKLGLSNVILIEGQRNSKALVENAGLSVGEKVHSTMYPQTARAKNNYFAINSYKAAVKGKATPRRHKTSKIQGKTTIKDSMTPSSKENCGNSTKYETIGTQDASRKEIPKSEVEIKTTREFSNEMITSLNTGRESLIYRGNDLTGTRINEETLKESKRSLIKILDPTSNEIARRDLKDILENASNDLKTVNYKAPTNKRNASHGKTRASKSNALSKKSSRGNKQTKSRVSTNRAVPKKKHVKNKATTSF